MLLLGKRIIGFRRRVRLGNGGKGRYLERCLGSLCSWYGGVSGNLQREFFGICLRSSIMRYGHLLLAAAPCSRRIMSHLPLWEGEFHRENDIV